MNKTIKIIAFGRVQGVGFRWSTQAVAEKLAIRGTVRNLPDGTVEIIAQSNEQRLSEFIQAIKAGPSTFANVSQLKIETLEIHHDYPTFRII